MKKDHELETLLVLPRTWKLQAKLRVRFKNALSGVDVFEDDDSTPPLSRCALAPANLDVIEGDSLFWARISQLRRCSRLSAWAQEVG